MNKMAYVNINKSLCSIRENPESQSQDNTDNDEDSFGIRKKTLRKKKSMRCVYDEVYKSEKSFEPLRFLNLKTNKLVKSDSLVSINSDSKPNITNVASDDSMTELKRKLSFDVEPMVISKNYCLPNDSFHALDRKPKRPKLNKLDQTKVVNFSDVDWSFQNENCEIKNEHAFEESKPSEVNRIKFDLIKRSDCVLGGDFQIRNMELASSICELKGKLKSTIDTLGHETIQCKCRCENSTNVSNESLKDKIEKFKSDSMNKKQLDCFTVNEESKTTDVKEISNENESQTNKSDSLLENSNEKSDISSSNESNTENTESTSKPETKQPVLTKKESILKVHTPSVTDIETSSDSAIGTATQLNTETSLKKSSSTQLITDRLEKAGSLPKIKSLQRNNNCYYVPSDIFDEIPGQLNVGSDSEHDVVQNNHPYSRLNENYNDYPYLMTNDSQGELQEVIERNEYYGEPGEMYNDYPQQMMDSSGGIHYYPQHVQMEGDQNYVEEVQDAIDYGYSPKLVTICVKSPGMDYLYVTEESATQGEDYYHDYVRMNTPHNDIMYDIGQKRSPRVIEIPNYDRGGNDLLRGQMRECQCKDIPERWLEKQEDQIIRQSRLKNYYDGNIYSELRSSPNDKKKCERPIPVLVKKESLPKTRKSVSFCLDKDKNNDESEKKEGEEKKSDKQTEAITTQTKLPECKEICKKKEDKIEENKLTKDELILLSKCIQTDNYLDLIASKNLKDDFSQTVDAKVYNVLANALTDCNKDFEKELSLNQSTQTQDDINKSGNRFSRIDDTNKCLRFKENEYARSPTMISKRSQTSNIVDDYYFKRMHDAKLEDINKNHFSRKPKRKFSNPALVKKHDSSKHRTPSRRNVKEITPHSSTDSNRSATPRIIRAKNYNMSIADSNSHKKSPIRHNRSPSRQSESDSSFTKAKSKKRKVARKSPSKNGDNETIDVPEGSAVTIRSDKPICISIASPISKRNSSVFRVKKIVGTQTKVDKNNYYLAPDEETAKGFYNSFWTKPCKSCLYKENQKQKNTNSQTESPYKVTSEVTLVKEEKVIRNDYLNENRSKESNESDFKVTAPNNSDSKTEVDTKDNEEVDIKKSYDAKSTSAEELSPDSVSSVSTQAISTQNEKCSAKKDDDVEKKTSTTIIKTTASQTGHDLNASNRNDVDTQTKPKRKKIILLRSSRTQTSLCMDDFDKGEEKLETENEPYENDQWFQNPTTWVCPSCGKITPVPQAKNLDLSDTDVPRSPNVSVSRTSLRSITCITCEPSAKKSKSKSTNGKRKDSKNKIKKRSKQKIKPKQKDGILKNTRKIFIEWINQRYDSSNEDYGRSNRKTESKSKDGYLVTESPSVATELCEQEFSSAESVKSEKPQIGEEVIVASKKS